ncbi:MAG: hypothetical protein QHJ73_05430 [Armatimonadota bacterium]|nr:hypothetical protein [Armatimonadota bacterium]
MEKLDRLGWAEGICFSAYGVRVGLRANRPGVLSALGEYLPPGWRPVDSPLVDQLFSIRMGGADGRRGLRRYHLLYGGILQLCRTLDDRELFEAIENHVQLNIAADAPRRVFIHACVVGWAGRAVVIPGRTHTGKSQLVAALLRAGAEYFSEEYAVLDPRGRVYPYPRRLSLREEEGAPPVRVAAAELGARTARRSLPAGLVLFTEYRPGARWRPRVVPPGAAALMLLENTVCARTRPRAALAAVRRLAMEAPVLKSARGEADETALRVLAAVGAVRR